MLQSVQGVVRQRRDYTESARGKESLWRDVMLQRVNEGKGSVGRDVMLDCATWIVVGGDRRDVRLCKVEKCRS